MKHRNTFGFIGNMIWPQLNNTNIGKLITTCATAKACTNNDESRYYAHLLQDSIARKSVSEAKRIHTHMIENIFRVGTFLENRLIDLHLKYGSVEDARQVFDKMAERDISSWNTLIGGYTKIGVVDFARELFERMPERDEVSWNTIIGCYARHGYSKEALKLFSQMKLADMKVNHFTFGSVLSACACMEALDDGVQVHLHAIKTGFDLDVVVGSTLIDMYAKCEKIEDARKVFDKMPERDVVLWTSMISGYARCGHGKEEFELFRMMNQAGMKTSQFIFASVLSSCANLLALEQGKQLHVHVIRSGFESNVYVGSALVDMYAKCSIIEDARQIFHGMPKQDAVSWTAMIGGCTENGQAGEALKLFYQMQKSVVKMDHFTLANVLSACSCQTALDYGKQVHTHIFKIGFEMSPFVGSALLDMYAKCGSIEDAHQLLNEMTRPDGVSWNALIAGYVRQGDNLKALMLFGQMRHEGLQPDQFTFACILSAAASLASLKQGKQIHGYIIRTKLDSNIFVGSALIDMYAKCGSIEDARHVFNKVPGRDGILWNAMIVGYALNGCGKEAIHLFESMLQAGMKPDDITFIGVLSACSHAGLVNEGRDYFESMSQNHCIAPKAKHYACMIDLVGRAGLLNEARDLIDKMPFKSDTISWGALLSACRIHGNTELAKQAAEWLFELEPENATTYVLLSNIYAAAGRWDDVSKVRKMMKERGVTKMPGYSWIEVKNRMHTFMVHDRSHPETEEIYAALKGLTGQMKEAGYVPDTNFVFYDVEGENKENILYYHSEKLAIVFGIISTPPGTPIRVVNNLRVCGDCHAAIKVLSKIAHRYIVLRDANRFHHFKDGTCSCGDYW